VLRLIHEAGASAALPNVPELAVVSGLHELLPRLLAAGAVFRSGTGAVPCLPMLFLNGSVPVPRIALTLAALVHGGVRAPLHRLRLDAANPMTLSTALHSAAFLHKEPLVAHLLVLGANPLAMDDLGETPLAVVRGLLRGRRRTPVSRAELLRFETTIRLPPVEQALSPLATSADDTTTTTRVWRTEALAVEATLLRALALRDCELAIMMAVHPRLGAATPLHRVETTLLVSIARAACVFTAPSSSA
jgi:hypothetical protein